MSASAGTGIGPGATFTGNLAITPEGWAQIWQPIETAPKDGTPVLAFAPIGDLPVTRVLSCNDGEWLSWPGPHRYDPTHWMPLPTPPA
jgi:hypothetical protein